MDVTTLTSQVMERLSSLVGNVSNAFISDVDDSVSQKSNERGKRLYETVYSRFARETDGGKAGRALQDFAQDPDYSSVVEKKLSRLIQDDQTFADTLRQIITASSPHSTPFSPFVGREREQQEYQQFLTRETPWIMAISGQAGSGKSALLRHLAEDTPPNTLVVSLDFANGVLQTDPLTILGEFASLIQYLCDVQLVLEFKRTLRQGRQQLIQLRNQIVVTQTIEVSDNAKLQDVKLNLDIDDAIHESRHHVQELIQEAFYNQLDTFSKARLVLVLDSCDWLSESEHLEVGQWVMNELIPKIHSRMNHNSKQCSVVIASRMQAHFEAIEDKDIIHLRLNMLDRMLIDQYLEQVGMQDRMLRERIYDITQGHPLLISIIVALWHERGEQPFTIADLPMLEEQFNERALLEFIQERILNNRLKSPLRTLTRYGVLLRKFNLPMLRAVFPDLLPELEAVNRFHQLIGYSYIEPMGNDCYAFNDLLREILIEEVRIQEPDKWNYYHHSALDYLNQIPFGLPYSSDRYYYAINLDERQGMLSWKQAMQDAYKSGDSENLSTLLQVVYDKTLKLTPIARAERIYEQGRYYDYYTSQREVALKSYEEALNLYHQVGSKLEEAIVLEAIGNLQRIGKDTDSALESYKQALSLYQEIGDRFREANIYAAIGKVQDICRDTDAALQSYDLALSIYQLVGDRLGKAYVLRAIGDVQRSRKDTDAALQSYEKALSLYRQMGDRLGEEYVLQAIDGVRHFSEDLNAALKMLPAESTQTTGDAQPSRKDMPPPKKAIEIFFSYAHEDEKLRDKLEKQLNLLKRQGLITNWYDRNISAGTEWARQIDMHLTRAHIILLLVSDSFIDSEYSYGKEMIHAMERHEAGEARVIPIILRPVDWEGAPFGKLEALPKDAKPVTTWTNRDAAFLNIAKGIRKAVEEMMANR